MKKLTYEFVKKSFEKEGYTLLSKEYKNSKTKLEYICPKGHRHGITWSGWCIGNRCPYCSGKIKKTIEAVSESFKSEGYKLLTETYINSHQKLKYICSKGHEHYITWFNWNTGYRCPYCAGQIKPTIKEIREAFASEGYELLSDTYKTNKTKLRYRCPERHTHKISWLKWQQGRRCRKCSYIIRGINNSGPNHPHWRGGTSFEPYCEAWKDKEYKQDIRDRDKNMCLNPYCNSLNKNDLTIHHIDYNKKNCKPSNLITVCRSCNIRANTDRDWHKAWYQAIMYKRYNYNY